jgi:hypothetical protein
MPARSIARCCTVLAVALMAAACSAQVMGAPGTLPNGRHVPVPPGQELPPDTTPQQPTPRQSQPAAANQAATPSAPITPAAPAAPSLLDKPAQPATVILTGGKLSVTANNSSLTEILHQLAASSGMTIDGLDKDTRVFGAYGPGDPRDILNELLDGAGYNVLMIGETAGGAPRQLVLTVRSNAPITPQPASSMAEQEEDQDDAVPMNNNYPPPGEVQPRAPEAPPQPPPQQQNPNGTAKTPQQILQEMMQQRQQQQQQQNPQ